MAEEQIKLKQALVNTPVTDINMPFLKEQALNEMSGIMLVLALPHFQLDGIEEEIESLKLELHEEEDNEDETY